MDIGNFHLGKPNKPYIIAEIGVNHECDIALAKKMIFQATESGAHAVKFQSYKADSLAIKNSPSYWDREKETCATQFELFKRYDAFGEKEYAELARYSVAQGVDFLSTPFDVNSVAYLKGLVPAFKLASADITNVPLIRSCASTGKPLIMSTGASELDEIHFAVKVARDAGAKDIALLHCVLNYPTSINDAQIAFVKKLKEEFPDCSIGYSDHVPPDTSLTSLEMATLLGAEILEKHFTHNKLLPGNDHYHSMDSDDLSNFCSRLQLFNALYGGGEKNIINEADARLHARRSIVAAESIKAGEIFTEKNLTTKRPAHGMSPIYWDEVIGKVCLSDMQSDDLICPSKIGSELQDG